MPSAGSVKVPAADVRKPFEALKRHLSIFTVCLLFAQNGSLCHADGIHADFKTSAGDFSVVLHHAESPQAVANFIGLAEGSRAWIDPLTGAVVTGKPFYSGLVFHRVIAGFMNQGGCPLGNGTSGPGYSFRDEFSPTMKHDRPYRLSMANSGMNTNGSQFFITVAATPWLDGVHTVFGTVESGMAVVDAINGVPTNGGAKPLNPVVIQSVGIRRDGQAAAAFDIHGQALPSCSGSRGQLGVIPGNAATWTMDLPLAPGAILRGFRSADLGAWSVLGEVYQDPADAPLDNLTLDTAELPRAFYRLSLIDYPDTLGTTGLAGGTITAMLPGSASLVFVFDAGGAAGVGNYSDGAGDTPFEFSVADAAAGPYRSTWILNTSAFGYLRLTCGLDSRANGVTAGRHKLEQWSGPAWSEIATGALFIDG